MVFFVNMVYRFYEAPPLFLGARVTKGVVVLDTADRPLSTAGIRGAVFKHD